MKANNDNEKFSFITLSAATRNVVRYLGLDEQKDDSGNEGDAGNERDQKALEQREFVQRRLREIERFEDRARGRRGK
jgi:hypothetical protein